MKTLTAKKPPKKVAIEFPKPINESHGPSSRLASRTATPCPGFIALSKSSSKVVLTTISLLMISGVSWVQVEGEEGNVRRREVKEGGVRDLC